MAIKVVKPGLSTTVQDLGRPGYYHIGIPDFGRHGSPRVAGGQLARRQRGRRGGSGSVVSRAGAGIHFGCDRRRHRRGIAAQGRRRAARDLDFIQGQEGPDARVRFSQERRARLYRRLRRRRRAGRARVAFDLHARRARRPSGAQTGGRRQLPLGAGVGAPEGRTVRAASAPRAGVSRRTAHDARPLLASHHRRRRASISSTTSGKSRPKPTASAIASAADRPLEFVPREPPFGAGSDPSNIVDACYPYGSIQVPAARSRSCCIATQFRAAAIS